MILLNFNTCIKRDPNFIGLVFFFRFKFFFSSSINLTIQYNIKFVILCNYNAIILKTYSKTKRKPQQRQQEKKRNNNSNNKCKRKIKKKKKKTISKKKK